MKRIRLLLVAVTMASVPTGFAQAAAGGLTGLPHDLRVEYLPNPQNVETTSPRLFWKSSSQQRAAVQSAYQVVVASSRDRLTPELADLWDSGKVASDQSAFVRYAGKALQPAATYWWTVRQWGADEKVTSWSEPAHWQMGVPQEEWQGSWIASDLQLMDHQKLLRGLTDFGMIPTSEIWKMHDPAREVMAKITEAPAVHLRKEFATSRTLFKATALVSGLGLNELYINGEKISDRLLSPAYTDYDKTVPYEVFDVTRNIKTGPNAIGVLLGNGWFNLITPHALRYYAADYINPPQLRMDLRLQYADGTSETISTSPEWKATTGGPIRFNCILAGETYDARKELTGWDEAGYDDSWWTPAREVPAPKGRLRTRVAPAVRVITTGTAMAVKAINDNNTWQFDLGAETTGWSRLRMKGKPGQKVVISYPGSGSHTFGRYQTCEYYFKSDDWETYAPRFMYGGYRTIEVSGLDYEPALTDLVIEVVSTDLEQTGSFAASDERFNQMQEIMVRTLRNYVMHIPADPTREKAGWTQDVHSNFWSFGYNTMAAAVWANWQRDFIDAVQANGYMPPVVPSRFDGPDINGPWWGGAVIYGPWYMYEFYGDKEILAESYEAMQKQFGYLQSIAKDDRVEWGLGDWLEVGAPSGPIRTPVPQTSTAAYAWFADILARTAAILGKDEDVVRYRNDAERIKVAYNRHFLKPETGEYANGSQTSQLISLHLGLVPDEHKARVLERLFHVIKQDNYHLSSGFVGMPILLPELTKQGQPDLAWTIATQTTFPSFFDAILNRGNTVFKEDWTGGQVQMPNLQGHISPWFYESLAGIRRDPAYPGMKRIQMHPETSNTLTWVRAHHDNLYGRIESEWKKEGSTFTWKVTVPANTTAEIRIPAKNAAAVKESGRPLGDVAGASEVSYADGYVKAILGSGTYLLSSEEAF